MNEKDDAQIEELLNSFIDDELNERQQTEIKRLQADVNGNNGAIQLCRHLLASLAAEEVKGETAEAVEQSEAAKPNGEAAVP